MLLHFKVAFSKAVSIRAIFTSTIKIPYFAISSSRISRFSPSTYTIIDETPVLINTGIEKFVFEDLGFSDYLKKTYWTKISEAQRKANIDKQMKEFENQKKTMPDSVIVINKSGSHKVPTSNLRLNVISIESSLRPSSPKSWILYFQGVSLQRETEDRYYRIEQ